MILQSLVDYYEALGDKGEIAQPGWCLEKVYYSLNISASGELLGLITQTYEATKGKKTVQLPSQMQVPERVVRTVGIEANLLCDNTSYMLGFDKKGKPGRSRQCFEACKKLHLEVLDGCTGKAAQAVKAFFENWKPELALGHPVLQAYLDDLTTANLVLRIEGDTLAHEEAEIRSAWQRYYSASDSGEKQRCLVTGKVEPLAVLHGRIKGVVGAQSSGASLISYNAPAYESYGMEGDQPKVAVGKYAAFAYVTAINHLLADRDHVCRMGDTMVIYWSEGADPVLQDTFSLMATPNENDDAILAGIMQNLAQGLPIHDVDMNKRFYILGLAPNAARISVRFFLQDTFGNMIENLRRHYDDLEIQRPSFDLRQHLSIPTLFSEIYTNSWEEGVIPHLSASLFASIFSGKPYPGALLPSVITRIRADKKVSRGRMAIVKAYLIRNEKLNEVATMALNESFDNRAYILGRLFAVLEDAQKKASPSLNTTIKDRYFTSACATPARSPSA